MNKEKLEWLILFIFIVVCFCLFIIFNKIFSRPSDEMQQCMRTYKDYKYCKEIIGGDKYND